MKKKFIALFLGLTLIAALAACGNNGGNNQTTAAPTEAPTEAVTEAPTEGGSEEATEAESGEETEAETKEAVEPKGTIKVGHLLDLTGVEAITGAVAQKAFNFAAQKLEEKTGWHFDIVEGDCQSDSDKAQTQAETMISQGCKVIFGPTQIGHKKSVLGYVADNPCPVVLYNGSPAAFTGGMLFGNDMIVALGGGTAGFPTVMADYLYNEVGLRTVYCFKQQTVGGNNYVDPFVTCFEAMGGKVLGNIEIPQPTNDWSGYMTTIMNSDAEAIVGWTSSSDAIAFYKEWYNSGAYEKLPVYGTMHGGFTDSYVMGELDSKIVDAVIEHGTLAPICYAYSIDNEANKELVDEWKAEFNEVPIGNNLSGSVYQALECLTVALDAVGPDADPQTLADAMRAAEFDGPEGHTVFADGTVVATKDVYVVKVVKLEDGSINYEVQEVYEQVGENGYNYDGSAYTGN